ncbi:MAG: 3'-5' exonuclease [Chloroflexi bacterium]|nr:MAG: 3'-5' exonuclease [Chloroflexota bacterium]MBL1195155.1 3'-5' exonuclease [Chloroflexota bacterium]NOH12440.1 3'-5' exonuclease [Chloroflexota bacterium]
MRRSQGRETAKMKAKEIIGRNPLYLDTETTGTGRLDEVIDLAVINSDGTVLFDSLVKPTIPIPAGATRVHQLDDAMVSRASEFDEIYEGLTNLLRSRVVAIFNAEFDVRLLRQSAMKHNLGWQPSVFETVCVMNLYAQYYGEWSDYHQSYTWQSLEKARRQLGINLPNTHRALDDALLAREVLHRMAA